MTMENMLAADSPYRLERGDSGALCVVSDAGCVAVLENNPYQEGIDDRENGERIVRAVNSHDDLLETCKEVEEASRLAEIHQTPWGKPVLWYVRLLENIAKAEKH